MRCVEDAARIGFRTRQTLAALEELASSSPNPPIGLVLGSGFEDRPKLVVALARRFRLLGNDAATIARAKAPAALRALLERHAIAYPLTRMSAPADLAGWITKRIGGSGGTHIMAATDDRQRSVRRYYQQRLDGTPHSVLALATHGAAEIVGMSRQWPVGREPNPYRYGGAVGPVELPPTIATAMRAAAEALCAELKLIGLVSFDFLVVGDQPYLLEINPRPGATLDIFDDAAGTLFHAHVAACNGKPHRLPNLTGARASAILYADRGALSIEADHWPDWVADRPMRNSRVTRHRPIATVFASAPTPDAAFRDCLERLEELGDMLYGLPRNKERNDDAEVHRPRPERISARRQAR